MTPKRPLVFHIASLDMKYWSDSTKCFSLKLWWKTSARGLILLELSVQEVCTRPITRFHRTNSKEAISMWPDMHSFSRFHTFEPIDFLLFSLRKVDHVLRFTNFTDSDCPTFYQSHKFGPILARICEFCKTTNQKLITWVILSKTKHVINLSKRR